MSSIYDKLTDITTFVFDVDGVFTDSRILLMEDGTLLRSMNVRDGYAIKIALQEGFQIHIITGGSSAGVVKRLKGLGITDIHIGIRDKISVLNEIMEKNELTPDELLYMGDDEIDVPCLQLAGFSCAPHDADVSALNTAEYVSHKKGGDGCVREVVQMVLEAQSKWKILI